MIYFWHVEKSGSRGFKSPPWHKLKQKYLSGGVMNDYRPNRNSFRALFKRGVWPKNPHTISLKSYFYHKALLEQTRLEECITKKFENYITILKFSARKADISLANAALEDIAREFKQNGKNFVGDIQKDKLVFFIKRLIYFDLDIALSKKAIDTLELLDSNNLLLVDKNRNFSSEVKDYLKEKLKYCNTIDF